MGLGCNLNNKHPAEITRIFGTRGTLEIKRSAVTVIPQDTRARPEAYPIFGWPKKLRTEYLEQWQAEHLELGPGQLWVIEQSQTFEAPAGYDETLDHMNNFMQSVRRRKLSVEHAMFGNHTTIACHMANYSYFKKAPAVRDPAARNIKG